MNKVNYIISLITIILIAIGFATLFILYSKYKNIAIKNKNYDEKIKNDFNKKYQVYLKKKNKIISKKEFYTLEKKEEKITTGIFNCFFSLINVFLLSVMISGFVFKANDEHFYLGDTTYMVIKTPSMETVNDENKYLD